MRSTVPPLTRRWTAFYTTALLTLVGKRKDLLRLILFPDDRVDERVAHARSLSSAVPSLHIRLDNDSLAPFVRRGMYKVATEGICVDDREVCKEVI